MFRSDLAKLILAVLMQPADRERLLSECAGRMVVAHFTDGITLLHVVSVRVYSEVPTTNLASFAGCVELCCRPYALPNGWFWRWWQAAKEWSGCVLFPADVTHNLTFSGDCVLDPAELKYRDCTACLTAFQDHSEKECGMRDKFLTTLSRSADSVGEPAAITKAARNPQTTLVPPKLDSVVGELRFDVIAPWLASKGVGAWPGTSCPLKTWWRATGQRGAGDAADVRPSGLGLGRPRSEHLD